MAETPIESGRYSPNNTVNLTVWNEGDNPPDGYDVERTSDGSKVAVVKDRGDVKRDDAGNAYAIPEGGALVEYPDGSVETLTGESLNDFVKRYQLDGSGSGSTSTDSTAQASDQRAANPETTMQQGVTQANNTSSSPTVSPDAGSVAPESTASGQPTEAPAANDVSQTGTADGTTAGDGGTSTPGA